jgi:hypothetical protein
MRRAYEGNIPAAPLKWNSERAATEFGLTGPTLRKLLAKNSAQADADGLYSTKQICDAVFGGLNEEKLLTQRQMTRKLELENQITEGSVLNRAALETGFAAVADAMVSRIMVSELDRSAKEDLLRDLSGVPLILENVARSQTRLPRGKGKHHDEDQSEFAS